CLTCERILPLTHRSSSHFYRCRFSAPALMARHDIQNGNNVTKVGVLLRKPNKNGRISSQNEVVQPFAKGNKHYWFSSAGCEDIERRKNHFTCSEKRTQV